MCITTASTNSMHRCIGVRVSDLKEIGAFFDVFQAHGHYEVRGRIHILALQRPLINSTHTLTHTIFPSGRHCMDIRWLHDRRISRQAGLEEARPRRALQALAHRCTCPFEDFMSHSWYPAAYCRTLTCAIAFERVRRIRPQRLRRRSVLRL